MDPVFPVAFAAIFGRGQTGVFMRRAGFLAFLLLPLLAAPTLAATPTNSSAGTTKAYIAAHKKQIVQEYLKLAGSPSLHGDVPNLKKTADLLLAMMKQR